MCSGSERRSIRSCPAVVLFSAEDDKIGTAAIPDSFWPALGTVRFFGPAFPLGWGAATVPAVRWQFEFFRVVERRSSMLSGAPRKGWRVGANLHGSCPCMQSVLPFLRHRWLGFPVTHCDSGECKDSVQHDRKKE